MISDPITVIRLLLSPERAEQILNESHNLSLLDPDQLKPPVLESTHNDAPPSMDVRDTGLGLNQPSGHACEGR